jgi:hypothetical protein
MAGIVRPGAPRSPLRANGRRGSKPENSELTAAAAVELIVAHQKDYALARCPTSEQQLPQFLFREELSNTAAIR